MLLLKLIRIKTISLPWGSPASEEVNMVPVVMIHSVNLHHVRQLTNQAVVVLWLTEVVICLGIVPINKTTICDLSKGLT